jgi:hypothetical protein
MALELRPDGIVDKQVISEYSEAPRAKASLERLAEEKQSLINNTQIERDNSNVASFPGFPYKMKAFGTNILVIVDTFKSGYECRECKGLGYRVEGRAEHTGEFLALNLPKMVIKNHQVKCEACGGKGTLLHLADESKALPCTGVVASMGAEAMAQAEFKLYDRVLFGPFSGRFVPLKAGVLIKLMGYREASGGIEGGEDLASFDFITYDKEM